MCVSLSLSLSVSVSILLSVSVLHVRSPEQVPDPLADVRAGDIWLTWSDRLKRIDAPAKL